MYDKKYMTRETIYKNNSHTITTFKKEVLLSMAPLIVDTCILLKQNFLNDCNDNKEV